MMSDLEAAADVLEANEYVDDVIREPDGMEDTVMVRLDWVTEEHQENGVRIIDDHEYDGHIRKVCQIIRDLEGVRKTRMLDSGLHARTIYVEPGRGWA